MIADYDDTAFGAGTLTCTFLENRPMTVENLIQFVFDECYFRFHVNTLCMLLLLIGYKWFCVFLSQDTYNISRYIIVKEQYKYFSVFTRFLSVLKKFSTWQIDLKFHSLHNWQIVFLQRMCIYKILVDSFYSFFSKLHS